MPMSPREVVTMAPREGAHCCPHCAFASFGNAAHLVAQTITRRVEEDGNLNQFAAHFECRSAVTSQCFNVAEASRTVRPLRARTDLISRHRNVQLNPFKPQHDDDKNSTPGITNIAQSAASHAGSLCSVRRCDHQSLSRGPPLCLSRPRQVSTQQRYLRKSRHCYPIWRCQSDP